MDTDPRFVSHVARVIQELGERTEGAWSPSPGSVYPTLTLLEEEGLITGEDVDGKRRFTITDAGRAEVDGREDAPPWEQFADGDNANQDIREVMGSMMGAVKQVFRAGTPAQQTKAVTILAETAARCPSSLWAAPPPVTGPLMMRSSSPTVSRQSTSRSRRSGAASAGPAAENSP